MGRARVRVWALAPPRSALLLQREIAGHRWQTIGLLHAGPDGVLNALVRLKGAALLRLHARATISAPAQVGSTRSIVQKPGR
jgi:hypothetical protein